MSRDNPYGYGPSTLNYLAHHLANSLGGYVADTPPPTSRQGPREPWSGLPMEPRTDTAAEAEALRNPSAKYEGEAAVDAEMDKANTESWAQKMKAARDATPQGRSRAFQNKMRAAKEGQKAVDKEMDKANTESWSERMKRAKSAPPTEQLLGHSYFDAPLTPEDFGMKTAPDPRSGPAGEDAVRQALINMNMRELIDQGIQDRVREFIKSQIPAHFPPVPESDIPANVGAEGEMQLINPNAYRTVTPGVTATPPGVASRGIKKFIPPVMVPANKNTGFLPNIPVAGKMLFGPMVTNPDQPHFPVGVDPNLPSPSPPPVE